MEIVDGYAQDGAILIKNVLSQELLEQLENGIEENLANPSVFASDYVSAGQGRYFGDYCNWNRFKGIERVALSAALAKYAADLMQSETVKLFHEHVLVKEPHTTHYTPWHQDQPYYIADGNQTVSFWIPLDPVDEKTCPKFVAGSHKWNGLFKPRYFKNGDAYIGSDDLQEVPDFDNQQEGQTFLNWKVDPGDVIAFHFKTMHNAPTNDTDGRRRVVSLRYLGDDVRWKNRKHKPSPPYPDMGLQLDDGDELPTSWFPIVWPQ